MSEIEKMMQNANVKKHWNSTPYGGVEEYYPPFTAEKQIELIKWLELNDFIDALRIVYRPFEKMWIFQIYMVIEFASEKAVTRLGGDEIFENALASLINNLWQDLTEEERKQIKEILE